MEHLYQILGHSENILPAAFWIEILPSNPIYNSIKFWSVCVYESPRLLNGLTNLHQIFCEGPLLHGLKF